MKRKLFLITVLVIIGFIGLPISVLAIAADPIADNTPIKPDESEGGNTPWPPPAGMCIVYGSNSELRQIGYRLTFVYVGTNGEYEPYAVTRTNAAGVSRQVTSTDILIDDRYRSFISDSRYSKFEYVRKISADPSSTFNFVGVSDDNYADNIEQFTLADTDNNSGGNNKYAANRTKFNYLNEYYEDFINTKGGLNFLAKCVEDASKYDYCNGKRLLELFVGSDNTPDKKGDDWDQLRKTAIALGLLSEGSSPSDLANIVYKDKGKRLHLIVEPLFVLVCNKKNDDEGFKGIASLTEIITMYLANNKKTGGWQRVLFKGINQNFRMYDENAGDGGKPRSKRFLCVAPNTAYLNKPYKLLGVAQFSGIGVSAYAKSCSISVELNKKYQKNIASLQATLCKDGDCNYDYVANAKSYYTVRDKGIYLNPDFIFKNMGALILNLSDVIVKPYVVVYRPISLSNPFPGHNGDSRTPGANWASKNNSVINDYITNNRGVNTDKVYNLTPMYTITLTPTLISNIRQYNNTVVGGYGDDSLYECSDMKLTCKSKFIHSKYLSSFSGCAMNDTC